MLPDAVFIMGYVVIGVLVAVPVALIIWDLVWLSRRRGNGE